MGYQKAIAGAIGPLVTLAAAYFGMPAGIDPQTMVLAISSVTSIVTSALVYYVPNKTNSVI